MKDEYARVGVPMMPVVRGERETRRQILLYTGLLLVLTLLPVAVRLLRRDLRRRGARRSAARSCGTRCTLQRRADRRSALRTYLFSLGYLALLFCAMVLDARL